MIRCESVILSRETRMDMRKSYHTEDKHEPLVVHNLIFQCYEKLIDSTAATFGAQGMKHAILHHHKNDLPERGPIVYQMSN